MLSHPCTAQRPPPPPVAARRSTPALHGTPSAPHARPSPEIQGHIPPAAPHPRGQGPETGGARSRRRPRSPSPTHPRKHRPRSQQPRSRQIPWLRQWRRGGRPPTPLGALVLAVASRPGGIVDRKCSARLHPWRAVVCMGTARGGVHRRLAPDPLRRAVAAGRPRLVGGGGRDAAGAASAMTFGLRWCHSLKWAGGGGRGAPSDGHSPPLNLTGGLAPPCRGRAKPAPSTTTTMRTIASCAARGSR